jgi:hypothetical protein
MELSGGFANHRRNWRIHETPAILETGQEIA